MKIKKAVLVSIMLVLLTGCFPKQSKKLIATSETLIAERDITLCVKEIPSGKYVDSHCTIREGELFKMTGEIVTDFSKKTMSQVEGVGNKINCFHKVVFIDPSYGGFSIYTK